MIRGSCRWKYESFNMHTQKCYMKFRVCHQEQRCILPFSEPSVLLGNVYVFLIACGLNDCHSEIQNTQEIKRTLFNWMKQDKTFKFLRKSSFSRYVQQKQKNKQLIQLILNGQSRALSFPQLPHPTDT